MKQAKLKKNKKCSMMLMGKYKREKEPIQKEKVERIFYVLI